MAAPKKKPAMSAKDMADMRRDKKMGIKETSARDKRMDKKAGVKY